MHKRPVALITGAGRTINIGTAIARTLVSAGWDIAMTYWRPYDTLMADTFLQQEGAPPGWGSSPEELEGVCAELRQAGAQVCTVEADLAGTEASEQVFDFVEHHLGSVTALIMSHCHSVDSDILTTSVESFDRHFAVNARAVWLLVREFGRRFKGEPGSGRIIGITSDHTAGNLPYGASKGAMDRIIIAAAHEFRSPGIRANVINPGATDTGWMDTALMKQVASMTLAGRVGLPQDCANLVGFLCSPEGGWINGQLLYSDGGLG